MQHTTGSISPEHTAINVGTFDGVHRGHREVVSFLLSESAKRGLRPVIITFEPHPLAVVAPWRAPKLLELPSERRDILKATGADIVTMTFDEELRRLTAAQWLRRLRDEFKADLIVAGFDNTFGSDGMTMSLRDYQELAAPLGMEIVKAPVLDGISSTLIRQALGAGDVSTAASMLGRHYSLTGTVIHGRELGRRIGFPTANIEPDTSILIPAPGVYAADMRLDYGSVMRAVVNIGVAPTVMPGLPLTVEAHIVGFHGDLYGSTVRLDFLKRLRDEERFPDIATLKTRIAEDVRIAQII